MKLSDKAEEILEHLWIMTYEMNEEMANFKDLKTDRAAPEVKELLTLNYIDVSKDGIRLRKEGMKEAENAIRRHRLAERLMVDVLDLKKSLLEETACRFEHLLHKDVEESICTLLGHPAFCPHGKPIPQGRCCKKSERAARAIVSSLADVDKEAKGKVAYLHTRDNKKLQKLMAMGLLPGVSVEVIQRFPSYVLKIGNSQIAMDEEMARDVFIRWTKSYQAITGMSLTGFAWLYDPAVSLIGAIFGGEKRLRRKILRLADIKDGDRVIDIGCGTGTSALIIAGD